MIPEFGRSVIFLWISRPRGSTLPIGCRDSPRNSLKRNARRSRSIAGLMLATVLLLAPGAGAQEAARLCREMGTDDTLRAVPASLVPAAKRLFALRMPSSQVRRATV